MVPSHNFHIYGACRNKEVEGAFESYHMGKEEGGRKTLKILNMLRTIQDCHFSKI